MDTNYQLMAPGTTLGPWDSIPMAALLRTMGVEPVDLVKLGGHQPMMTDLVVEVESNPTVTWYDTDTLMSSWDVPILIARMTITRQIEGQDANLMAAVMQGKFF